MEGGTLKIDLITFGKELAVYVRERAMVKRRKFLTSIKFNCNDSGDQKISKKVIHVEFF